MPHIHTDPGQHDTTVSAYIVRLDGDEPRLMLHRHRVVNKYLQFGGHVELAEDPWAAITHELLEETGYGIGQLQLLQPAIRLKQLTSATLHPQPVAVITHKFGTVDHYHTDISYAFVTREHPESSIVDGESDEMYSCTANELRALAPEQIPEDVREIGLFVLEEVLKSWVRVSTAKFSVYAHSPATESVAERARRILTKLRAAYPGKKCYDLDGRGLHFVCEVEPPDEHPEYDRAVEVIIDSKPHKHLKMTQTYTILSGSIDLHIDDEKIHLQKGDIYTVQPDSVHWATSNDEAMVEIYSEPGWTKEDHIVV